MFVIFLAFHEVLGIFLNQRKKSIFFLSGSGGFTPLFTLYLYESCHIAFIGHGHTINVLFINPNVTVDISYRNKFDGSEALTEPRQLPVLKNEHATVHLPHSQLPGPGLLGGRDELVDHGRGPAPRTRPRLLDGCSQFLK